MTDAPKLPPFPEYPTRNGAYRVYKGKEYAPLPKLPEETKA